jgi:hypothetical protein
MGEFPENKGEYDHRKQGTYKRPEDADGRLLVTHEYVAPGKEEKQFTISEHIAKIPALGPSSLNNERCFFF